MLLLARVRVRMFPDILTAVVQLQEYSSSNLNTFDAIKLCFMTFI